MAIKLTNLKSIRKGSGLTQEQAAAELNVSKGTYRNWEQCLNAPDSEHILRICGHFGCTLDELVGRVPVESKTTEPEPQAGPVNPESLLEAMGAFAIGTLEHPEIHTADVLHEAIELGKWLLTEWRGGDAMTETIGARIAALRGERGWTARQLARKADLADESVISIEEGRGNPTVKTLEKIAEALGVGVGDLIG